MRGRADDRGSIPAALLVVLIGTSLSAVMMTLVLGQLSNTSYTARRVLALHAAQAGLDVGLDQVRQSTLDSNGLSHRENLPCTTLSGSVGAGNAATYTVSTAYYDAEPQGNLQNVTWVAAHRVQCAPGLGARTLPRYAVFTSTGTVVQGGTTSRTLRGTYTMHTSNANISGGLIHVYRADSSYNDLCLDGGAVDPAAGTVAAVKACTTGDVRQIWAYMNTLQIQLVSSQTPTHPTGMCLDAGTPHAANATVLLQPCQSAAPGLYQQQWSYTGVQGFAGTNTTGTAMDSYCFNVRYPNQLTANYLYLTTNCSGVYDNVHSFAPDAAVGAGMASATYGQLVNYNQFGRCLDVTGGNPALPNLIAWPCKQDPNPNNVSWNQRWTTPALTPSQTGLATNVATGTITTTKSPTTYCLTSPLSAATYQYVTTQVCTGGSNQRWTVYGKTDSYATSYQIQDSTGIYCLTPRDGTFSPPDWFQTVNSISKIYVAPCDGSTLQKWNGDRNVLSGVPLKDVAEQ